MRSLDCCAVKEFNGTVGNNGRRVLLKYGAELLGKEGYGKASGHTYVIFTWNKTNAKSCKDFCKIVAKEKLGVIIDTDFHKNLNHGSNKMNVLVFRPNREKVEKWYTKQMKGVTSEVKNVLYE